MDLGRDFVVMVVAIVLAMWASAFIEQRLMRMSHLDNNVRVVLAKIVRAVLILIGVLVALSTVGIDLTVLSVFGGALGVGIGLGLQKLASNYIAGFTILLDRSIRVGDMITVDNRFGVVSKVTARYVVVKSLDGVEAIVPNETLVTTTVLNHSYSSREIKVGVPIQISYDSDLDLAMRLMTEAALSEPRTLRTAAIAPAVYGVGLRRQRHQPRACGVDQRSRKRPGQFEIGPECRHLEGVSGQRRHDSLSPARRALVVLRVETPENPPDAGSRPNISDVSA